VRPFDSFDFGPVGLNVPRQRNPSAVVIFCAPNDDRSLLILCFFERSLGRYERFGGPLVDELINLLFGY
jgi:hypothetical protein